MLSESGSSLQVAEPTRKPNFSTRAELSEWMDQPCTYEEFRACLFDLAAVNRITFAYRPTQVWLERLVRGRVWSNTQPLHIVDVGCGQGDMLRYLARWARHAAVPVRFTGIDLNPYAARAAAEITEPGLAIEWVTSDAFSFAPQGGIDVVISSLFTHHLPGAEIARFVQWMESEARVGWFINDLHRGAVPYRLFRLLAWAARWHPFVQHDGPVSILRSFRRADWLAYLAEAGMDPGAASIEAFWPARLCVERLRG